MPASNRPLPIADVLDDNATFEPSALAAVRDLARSKPWQGTDDQRAEKFTRCAQSLAVAYSMDAWTIRVGPVDHVDPEARVATFAKLSVVTFLYFMGLARGHQVVPAHRWAINIFRRCFPRSFAACRQDGPRLVRE